MGIRFAVRPKKKSQPENGLTRGKRGAHCEYPLGQGWGEVPSLILRVTVRHHKGSEQLMMVHSNKLGSRRQVEEAGDDVWKANHFFLSSGSSAP